MSEMPDKKRVLKEIIAQLHAGRRPEEVKEKFKRILENVSSEDIARIEQELVQEGMAREEIQRLCDVHLAVFREKLEKQKLEVPTGHPLNILLEEHKIMLQLAEKLGTIAKKVQLASDKSYLGDEIHRLEHIARDFMDSEKHYLREENVLFPILEKHGITEPPAIMWTEHNHIREEKKKLNNLVKKYNATGFHDFKEELLHIAEALNEMLQSHFFKENNILFPTAMQVATKEEWVAMRKEFDDIGYCCFTPPQLIETSEVTEIFKEEAKGEAMPKEEMQFETGKLTKEEVEAILDTLPIDISFVDAKDEVKYFNKAEERIFVRTKAVLGRKVQLCHPQKSIHIVNKIIEAFKSGKKNVAEFWITLNEQLIHIRYFAIRNKEGKYLGTLEVTQNLTELKKIEGEKRLLDWES
ncbi:MAG: DUF438 domain-containing protein [Candidatus Bathyarchaeia archaeon]